MAIQPSGSEAYYTWRNVYGENGRTGYQSFMEDCRKALSLMGSLGEDLNYLRQLKSGSTITSHLLKSHPQLSFSDAAKAAGYLATDNSIGDREKVASEIVK